MGNSRGQTFFNKYMKIKKKIFFKVKKKGGGVPY